MSPAWDEVYATHYRRLVALVAVVAASTAEAEEAVQEAFVRALGPAGHHVDDPEAWLYRVATNVIRSRWRKIATFHRHAPRLAVPEIAPAGPELSGELITALRRLPYAQREALALHYMADLPIADIAIRTGVPIGTVKARLSRGRDALRALLANDEEPELEMNGGRRG